MHTELKKSLPACSKNDTGSTRPSARASSRKRWIVALPTAGLARAKLAASWAMGKYGEPNSSGSSSTSAPAAAACRTAASCASACSLC